MKANRKNRTSLDNLSPGAPRALAADQLVTAAGGVRVYKCIHFATDVDGICKADAECYWEEV